MIDQIKRSANLLVKQLYLIYRTMKIVNRLTTVGEREREREREMNQRISLKMRESNRCDKENETLCVFMCVSVFERERVEG